MCRSSHNPLIFKWRAHHWCLGWNVEWRHTSGQCMQCADICNRQKYVYASTVQRHIPGWHVSHCAQTILSVGYDLWALEISFNSGILCVVRRNGGALLPSSTSTEVKGPLVNRSYSGGKTSNLWLWSVHYSAVETRPPHTAIRGCLFHFCWSLLLLLHR